MSRVTSLAFMAVTISALSDCSSDISFLCS
jgi:hypothetical protein